MALVLAIEAVIVKQVQTYSLVFIMHEWKVMPTLGVNLALEMLLLVNSLTGF